MERKGTHWGVIDETGFSLISPRGIDGDEHETLEGALEECAEHLRNGAEQVAVVRCRYSAKHQCYVECPGEGCITLEAGEIDIGEIEDEDEEEGGAS